MAVDDLRCPVSGECWYLDQLEQLVGKICGLLHVDRVSDEVAYVWFAPWMTTYEVINDIHRAISVNTGVQFDAIG